MFREWAPGEGHLLDENGVIRTGQCAVFDYQNYLHDIPCDGTMSGGDLYPFICEEMEGKI